jgi:hypothetical protein
VSRTTKLPRIPGCLGIRRGHGPYKGRIGLDDRDVIISVPEGMSCIFCDLDRSILAETKLSFAVLDSFPVSDGHTLVIPKRHVASIWEMTTEEYTDTFKLVGKRYSMRTSILSPDTPGMYQIRGEAYVTLFPA